MSSALTVRAGAYTAAVVVAPFAALAWGDPGPVLVVLPVAVALVFAVMARPASNPKLEVTAGLARTIEGNPVPVHVEVTATATTAHVTLDLSRFTTIVKVAGARRVGKAGLVVPLVDGRGRADLVINVSRWGSYRFTGAHAVIPGPLGMTTKVVESDPPEVVVVLPEAEKVRSLVEPMVTNLHLGDTASTHRGPGFELAELRIRQPSDPPRSVNWRASARSDQMWVTDRHADRNGDLILVIDSVVEPGSDGEEAVGRVVRIASTMIKGYGQSRHRLGLISLSGHMRWFGLASGVVHEHRLLAAMMQTQAVREPIWMGVDRVIDRTVRRPSMVVFISPLLDDGVQIRVLRLARAGIDVVVVAVDPTVWIRTPRDPLRRAAHRIWHMERQRTLDLMAAAGVAVAQWRPGRPVDEILEEVQEWRRRLRRARI